jgi:hypothetical protein
MGMHHDRDHDAPPGTVPEVSRAKAGGHTHQAGPAPYVDYGPLPEDAESLIGQVLDQPWLKRGAEDLAVGWAIEHSLPEHEAAVGARVVPAVHHGRDKLLGYPAR